MLSQIDTTEDTLMDSVITKIVRYFQKKNKSIKFKCISKSGLFVNVPTAANKTLFNKYLLKKK